MLQSQSAIDSISRFKVISTAGINADRTTKLPSEYSIIGRISALICFVTALLIVLVCDQMSCPSAYVPCTEVQFDYYAPVTNDEQLPTSWCCYCESGPPPSMGCLLTPTLTHCVSCLTRRRWIFGHTICYTKYGTNHSCPMCTTTRYICVVSIRLC